MAYILNSMVSHPPHTTSQNDIKEYIKKIWNTKNKYVEQFFENSEVEQRHLSLPLEHYLDLKGLEGRNAIWQDWALALQKKNLEQCLNLYPDLQGKDLGAIFSTTVTGLSIPTLESKLMNAFQLNPNAKRIPLFGVGCLGGVSLINRAHDYLKAYPKELAIVMAQEFCTLTFQFDDVSMANFVGTSLFGDGAAMVVLCGEEHPLRDKAQLKILNTASYFYPDSERIMGWDIKDTGFQIVLSGDVPKIVEEKLLPNIQEFLSNNKVSLDEIQFYISHPGGPKVLRAIQKITHANDGNPKNLEESFKSLKENGNMSSVSVLDVLRRTLQNQNPNYFDSLGMLIAMGPAFASELTLIKNCQQKF